MNDTVGRTYDKRLAGILLTSVLLALVGCRHDRRVSDSTGSASPGNGTTLSAELSTIPSEHLDRIIRLFNRGVGLMDQYRPDDAVKAFEQVVELAPQWLTGRLNLGIAHLNVATNESYLRADEQLRKVIAADPENRRANYALGMLLRHQGRFDDAKDQFENVLRIDPDDADSHFQMGMLLADDDPESAREHLETTLRIIPHHESACYRLQALLRRQGDTQRALELLTRFQTLKANGTGVTFGMKYGEMGRYAEVVRALSQSSPEYSRPAAPAYQDIAEKAGLSRPAGGTTGWPIGVESEPHFGPGIAVADVDGDQDLDIFVPGVSQQDQSTLYLNEGEKFAVVSEFGVDGSSAIGAYFGDFDKDGDPDLYLTCVGPNRLYANEGNGIFVDATQSSHTAGKDVTSVGAAWADADHDGDLDLYVCNSGKKDIENGSASGAANAFFQNNGDGTFQDIAVSSGVDGGGASSVSVLFFDIDDDRDRDLVVMNHDSPNRLYLNDRAGQYRDASNEYPAICDVVTTLAAVVGDVDRNGWEDIILIRGAKPARLVRQIDRGDFVEDASFDSLMDETGGATGVLLGDLNLDGMLDLVLVDSGRDRQIAHRVLMNSGGGKFETLAVLGQQHATTTAHGALAVDLDRDGSLELAIARAGMRPELWRTPRPQEHHWLEVIPSKPRTDSEPTAEPAGVGLRLEIKTNQQLQVARVSSSTGYLGGSPPQAHFGLGTHGTVDYARLVWPDAVIQSELEIDADQLWRIPKILRKPSSCPILFAWNGDRFECVTDFLGVGGVGFFVGRGQYAPPDPTEDIRIPPSMIQPRNGSYLLRVAEPLEEVTYLDQLYLTVYDHPESWEIYPDERFTGGRPEPTGRPLAVEDKIFPIAAVDESRHDVREKILRVDRDYVNPPIDERFVGYAKDHWIELDFGQQLNQIPRNDPLILFLHGWVEYTYSHVNFAASQAGVSMRSPRIEIPDGNGGWKVAVADAGFPAGLPRMMTLDVSSLPIRQHGRFRIRSNMAVFWDQIFMGVDVFGPKAVVHRIAPNVAELRDLGYPGEYSPDGIDPTLYDYDRLDQGVAFKHLTGDYTRFGDVRRLLRHVDDQFVIMGRGEEIALEFDAKSLADPPAGNRRTVVLHADGYCKDMDLYTAFPDTVEPLPFHAMENYPPRIPAPARPNHDEYRRTWNTRRIGD